MDKIKLLKGITNTFLKRPLSLRNRGFHQTEIRKKFQLPTAYLIELQRIPKQLKTDKYKFIFEKNNCCTFRKGLPNETQCYSLVNLTPSGVFRILHIE